MDLYVAAEGLSLRHWPGESAAVACVPGSGATHLIATEALALVQAIAEHGQGMALGEIAHRVGLVVEGDTEVEAGLKSIIDGLVQSGLLHRLNDDAEPGGKGPR